MNKAELNLIKESYEREFKERLRDELIKYEDWMREKEYDIAKYTSEDIINEYLNYESKRNSGYNF